MLKVPLTKYEHIVAGDGMSVFMHITPKIDPQHLYDTCARLLEENPTLRSTCTPDGYMIVPKSAKPDVGHVTREQLMKMKFDVPASLQQRLQALSSTDEWKFRDGRQIRFLAHDLSDSTLLDIHFSHQCADGLCAILTCERFMQLLNPKEPVRPKQLKSITSDWMKAGFYEKYKDTVKPFNFDDWGKFSVCQLPRKNKINYKDACFHQQNPSLNPTRLKQLLKRTRAQGSTIMGVAWAAASIGYMAMQKKQGIDVKLPTNFLFRTPVNIRGIYPEWGVKNEDLTFGSFPILVPMHVDENTNIWDIARHTRNEMMKEIKSHHQERQFFCKHAMAPENAPEPENTVNGTSIGGFKFQDVYPSGHSVVGMKWLVTYALRPENALIHFDCFSTSNLGMQFSLAYMYPVISDHEGLAFAEGVQHAIDLMTDCDRVTLGELQEQLMLK